MARARKTPTYLTVEQIAEARGVLPGTIRAIHSKAMKHEDKYGKWPKGTIPKPSPDRPPEPGAWRRLYWRADRADVQKYIAGGGDQYPQLKNADWLRAEYAAEPDGKGRSVYSLAQEIGCSKDTLMAALLDAGITPRESAQTRTGKRKLSGMSVAELEAAIRRHGSQVRAAEALGTTDQTLRKALALARLEEAAAARA